VDLLRALSVLSGWLVGTQRLRSKSYINHRFVVSLLDQEVVVSITLSFSLPSLNHLSLLVLKKRHPAVLQHAPNPISPRRTRLS
jgi:hypothetical protein